MEIRIIKDVLVQALGAAQGFISKTDNNPALGCVKIVARGEEVTITVLASNQAEAAVLAGQRLAEMREADLVSARKRGEQSS